MNCILKYPGSKWSIADYIIANFPEGYEKLTYLEAFAGSLAVFFNKNRSVIETVNDIDGNVVNLFRVIRDNPDELARLIYFTPWSREEYKESYKMTGNSLEDARRFLVRMWQAIGSKSSDRTGWRNNIAALNGNVQQWSIKLPQRIIEVSDRFKHSSRCQVNIENQDALKLIKRHKRKNVFIYCDPPYVMSTKSSRIYAHEMTDEQHEELLQLLREHPGQVLISGYDNALYDEYLEDWHKEYKEAHCEGGKQAVEVLWMNYENVNVQMSLF